ncbi:MAG: stage sporulation protein [Gaiellaceae bacterium]|nr:stage sporulation protein [Gaiellaceae bacterium]
MLRPSILLFLSAAMIAAGPATAANGTPVFTAPAGSGALFVFSGHGWGHGVGMSQYGAYGYAQHGASFQQILAHYYPGTTLRPAPGTTFRVLLADHKKKLTLSSELPFTVKDGAGRQVALPAGAVTFGTGLKLAGQSLTAPLTFAAGRGGALTLTRAYRGKIQVDVVDGKLRAVNIVGLEQYLYGVVPSEMPSAWAPQALEAQAVAARSYALATRKIGAPYDAYSDTRSQMYLGLSNESAATTAAVTTTKGQALFFGNKVATTFFYSTSGGQTESSVDWTGTALPYLVSVPDPYDDISPYHNWGPVPVTAQTISKALKVPGPIMDATTVANAAGRVGKLNLVTPLAPQTVPATTLRSAIGLRSTWFTVGVMSLSSPVPSAPVAYGSPLTLIGTVRGVSSVTLEQRPLGGTWQSVGPVASGALKLTQKPTITTDYRLATGTAAAAFVRIRVAPAIQVTTFTTTQVAGSEQPVLPAAPMQVQQQNPDGTWLTIAEGIVNADGTFALPVTLTSGGTYRISLGPATGYTAGTTPPRVVMH